MSKVDRTPIYGPDGKPMILGSIIPEIPAAPKWAHDPLSPTHLDFLQYADWRMTKCRPFDPSFTPDRIENLDQSIHEMVGEVAELGELIINNGIRVLATAEGRAKLLDEIGDIFFTASWAGDAWGINCLRMEGAPGPGDFLPEADLEAAREIARRLVAADETPLSEEETESIQEVINSLAFQMNVLSGLLCNSFKKARWQLRNQNIETQALRIANVLVLATHLLAAAGFGVPDALARNVQKLDARFPEGYAGPGGGRRTGLGA